jgi:hypothetical protein
MPEPFFLTWCKFGAPSIANPGPLANTQDHLGQNGRRYGVDTESLGKTCGSLEGGRPPPRLSSNVRDIRPENGRR